MEGRPAQSTSSYSLHCAISQSWRESFDQNIKVNLALLHGKREPAALVPGDRDGVHLLLDGVPMNANLTGPDHETDREWHKGRKRAQQDGRTIHHGPSPSEPSPLTQTPKM